MRTLATQSIARLLDFAVRHHLVEEEDRSYAFNLFLDAMHMDAPCAFTPDETPLPDTPTPMLDVLTDIACRTGVINDTQDEKDRFSQRLAGLITPHPLLVRQHFKSLYETEGAQAATEWFYSLCRDCDYIRVSRVKKNVRFLADSPAGELEITINLSKPEKDPRDIAALKNAPHLGYPKCMLCPDNPGYAGRNGYPARQNHRVIPLTLGGQRWYMQYSPYLYYNEHCIVLNGEHTDMCISRGTFERLFDFVTLFPHYFLGSNADLPIVGGSILNHDHFQGGNYRFPMDKAQPLIPLRGKDARVSACVIDWPMSCIRLRSESREALVFAATEMLDAWREYSDPQCGIFAFTGDEMHNTITPILRRDGGVWTLSLVLRNNITSPEHPLGVFHPHEDLHHIKKENIGLIEVMGLFILPGRLLEEMNGVRGYLTGAMPIDHVPAEDSPLRKHYEWVRGIAETKGGTFSIDEAQTAIRDALAVVCARVLADAGVYKQNAEGREGILRFLKVLGYADMTV